MTRSTSMTRTLLMTAQISLLALVLNACSTGSNPVSLTPSPEAPTTSTSGVFQLAQTTPSVAAGLLRLDIASPDSLPESLSIQGVKYVRLSVELVPGRSSYVADINSAFQILTPISEVNLPGVEEATVGVTVLPMGSVTGERLYQSNISQVTFTDFLLVFALTQLRSQRGQRKTLRRQQTRCFLRGM